jgi:8-oxo-dGTP pyrophosphatase MutT (NUDIX family)
MPLNMRAAARAVLLDEDDRVLLVRFEFPTATVWALPGGGLDPGEDDEACLRRELREELGLRTVDIGPRIWTREHVIPMRTGHDGQRDHVHLVRVAHFEPVPEIGWAALRDELVHEMRWWTIDEIVAAGGPPDSPVRFAPSRIGLLLRQLLVDGPPAAPIDTGI